MRRISAAAALALAACSPGNFDLPLVDECAEGRCDDAAPVPSVETGITAEVDAARPEPDSRNGREDGVEDAGSFPDVSDDTTAADAHATDTSKSLDSRPPDPPDTSPPPDTAPPPKDAAPPPVDACGVAAKPYTAYAWATWPIPPDSPGASNYVAGTVCGASVITDKTTGLHWSATEEPGAPFTWEAAKARCAARGTGWRLPTRIELVSLVDYTKKAPPLLDPAFGASSEYLWSATPYTPSPSTTAWGIWTKTGHTFAGAIAGGPTWGVRCVR